LIMVWDRVIRLCLSVLNELPISADMFESVNKKTVVHPLFKVGLSLLKRLPEAARLNSDG
jgi:hypothetical protein